MIESVSAIQGSKQLALFGSLQPTLKQNRANVQAQQSIEGETERVWSDDPAGIERLILPKRRKQLARPSGLAAKADHIVASRTPRVCRPVRAII